MNAQSDSDALAAASRDDTESENESGKLTPQQLLLLQQQQLQLLQLAQLQSMSPSDLAVTATMAQQMLGMVMMPLMLPLNPMLAAAAAAAMTSASELHLQPASSDSALSDVLATAAQSASPLTLLGTPFALAPVGADDTPRRKRGRPPKKDAAARARADAEKTLLKQLPMWGYGLPLPLFPGFPGVLGSTLPPAAALLSSLASDHADGATQTPNDDNDRGPDSKADDGSDRTLGDRNHTGGGGKILSAAAKKKARTTGRPRGRPRTRPRPGEIVERVKPPAIAPATAANATYPMLYSYQLPQKGTELSTSGAPDEDVRVPTGSIGASLLAGEHE